MLIPVIQLGFASFGFAISYAVDTRQFVYELNAIIWTKHGVLYNV